MTAKSYRITRLSLQLVIEYQCAADHGSLMKPYIHTLAFGLGLLASTASAHAACYADYKAKKDNPLKLHYGVARIPDSACGSRGAAAKAIAPRLASAGWSLLNIVSVFDDAGLNGRKANAGQYFLRF